MKTKTNINLKENDLITIVPCNAGAVIADPDGKFGIVLYTSGVDANTIMVKYTEQKPGFGKDIFWLEDNRNNIWRLATTEYKFWIRKVS